MNPEQLKGLIRSSILAAFGFLGGIGVARGYFTTEELTSFTTGPIGTSLIGIGVTMIFGYLSRSQSNLVAAVAAIAQDPNSPVKAVVTTNTMAGREMANAMPETVVAAGTPEATSIAKAGNVKT